MTAPGSNHDNDAADNSNGDCDSNDGEVSVMLLEALPTSPPPLLSSL